MSEKAAIDSHRMSNRKARLGLQSYSLAEAVSRTSESFNGDYDIRNNVEIVRAVPEMRRTPIHLAQLSFSSAFRKKLISENQPWVTEQDGIS